MSLDIDVSSLIDSINQWFPAIFPILVIPAGIGIAVKLGQFLVAQFAKAF